MNIKILNWLLSHQRDINSPPLSSIMEWKRLFDEQSQGWAEPVDRAIVGGLLADRVAYAFAGGYHCALRRLVPSLPLAPLAALCVTEKGGGHPRAIESRLELIEADGMADGAADGESRWRLNGQKQFVTCAKEAELLLVVASTGTGADGRNRLRVLLLDRESTGLTIQPLPDLPFIPEISHGIVRFSDVEVRAAQLLPGDGYTRYVKPFRTIEDLHVFAAILAYLYRIACHYAWPQAIQEQLLTLLLTIRTLALSDPTAPAVHIAIGGLEQQIDHLLQRLAPHWATCDDAVRGAWERDKALMKIAGKVRSKRLAAAWARYRG